MESVPGQWDKQFAVHVGWLTMGVVRWGSSFFKLPPEPKAALEAVHGAEVGVYKLHDAARSFDYSAVFAAADKSMRRRGWERIVGVAQRGQFVAVYMPRDIHTFKRMGCCVVVLNDQNLVVASARGNLLPLFELATQHFDSRRLGDRAEAVDGQGINLLSGAAGPVDFQGVHLRRVAQTDGNRQLGL